MQGWYWNDHELCKYHNDYMYETIKRYPDRFEAYMCINPKFGDLAIDEVQRNYNRGFLGIGELGPGANNYKLTDFDFLNLMECAIEYEIPVNIHCNQQLGRNYPGKDMTPIEEFYKLAKRFPDLILILAHLGGGLVFYESIPEVRRVLKNVYYDLSANPLVYQTESIRSVVDIAGSDKILFGTDFPLLIYPSKSREKGFKLFIEDIRKKANLTDTEWTKIMYTNGDKILCQARNSYEKRR